VYQRLIGSYLTNLSHRSGSRTVLETILASRGGAKDEI